MRDDNQMLFQTEITNFYFSYTCLLFHMLFFLINLFILFIYFWLCWVFVAVRGLLSIAVHWLLIVVASLCRARAPGAQASAVVAHRLSSCSLWALERRLSSCGAQAQLLCGMWDPLGPGIEPVSPALAGGLSTTAPPGKPFTCFFMCLVDLVFYCTGINMDYGFYKSEIQASQGSHIFKVLKIFVFHKTRTWDQKIYIFFNILKCRFAITITKTLKIVQ